MKNFPRPDHSFIDVSVIIPAFNGSSTIAACLTSLQPALSGRNSEIIVVESSGDATADIVRQQFPEVYLIQSSQRLSAGAARNCGALQARGRLLFFVDQDCTVPIDWVSGLVQHLDDCAVGAAGGSVGIRNLSNLSGCAVYFLEFFRHFPQHRPPQKNANFLLGCNQVCRADIFQKMSFPEQTLGEDVLFSHAIRDAGFDVIYDANIAVQHWNRTGWGEFFRYNDKMGKAAADYHQKLQLSHIKPFLRFPLLAFAAPVIILPKIFLGLLRSNWQYLLRFMLLLPMCLLGNWVWAAAFYREILTQRHQ